MFGGFSSFKGLSHSALNSKILYNKGIPFSRYDLAGFDRTAHNSCDTCQYSSCFQESWELSILSKCFH
jgi:hypothetical protein